MIFPVICLVFLLFFVLFWLSVDIISAVQPPTKPCLYQYRLSLSHETESHNMPTNCRSVLCCVVWGTFCPTPLFAFFFLCMFLGYQRFIFVIVSSVAPHRGQPAAKCHPWVATHQEIGSQLWAGETLDSNQGLQDNSLVRYYWATTPPLFAVWY